MQPDEKVLILGVTGSIGRGLPVLFAAKGMEVTGVSRSSNPWVQGVSKWQRPDQLDVSGFDIVINLAGESVAQRWNKSNKSKFYDSRVMLTEHLVNAISEQDASDRPRVLINGSAVGYYGSRSDEELTESSSLGKGYLADLCRDWEAAASKAEQLGVRVVTLRTGVVIGRGCEAWEKLAGILKTGLGGPLGNGRQWMPWIHLEDLRAAIIHIAGSNALKGPVNGTAPTPETNGSLSRKVAAFYHRPAILPVPGFGLRMLLGGFASALLASQRALPKALLDDGFEFRFPQLEDALEDLV